MSARIEVLKCKGRPEAALTSYATRTHHYLDLAGAEDVLRFDF